MAYLFDTDAISEVLRRVPSPRYLLWLTEVGRADQFASTVSIAELFRGAFRSEARDRHVRNIEMRVLPSLTLLPFNVEAARVFGSVSAELERAGRKLADADLQIAATAIVHDLDLVTGNVKHFARVPGLRLERILADARSDESSNS